MMCISVDCPITANSASSERPYATVSIRRIGIEKRKRLADCYRGSRGTDPGFVRAICVYGVARPGSFAALGRRGTDPLFRRFGTLCLIPPNLGSFAQNAWDERPAWVRSRTLRAPVLGSFAPFAGQDDRRGFVCRVFAGPALVRYSRNSEYSLHPLPSWVRSRRSRSQSEWLDSPVERGVGRTVSLGSFALFAFVVLGTASDHRPFFESPRRSPPLRLGAVAWTHSGSPDSGPAGRPDPEQKVTNETKEEGSPDSGPAGRPDPAWVLGGAGSEQGRTFRESWHELALGDHFWPRRPLRSPWPPASSGRVPKSLCRARPHAAQPRGSQLGFPVGDGYTWSLSI